MPCATLSATFSQIHLVTLFAIKLVPLKLRFKDLVNNGQDLQVRRDDNDRIPVKTGRLKYFGRRQWKIGCRVGSTGFVQQRRINRFFSKTNKLRDGLVEI
jgi:hypothetical protein